MSSTPTDATMVDAASRTVLVRADDVDPRVRSVAAAFAARLGASVSSVSDNLEPDRRATVLCAAVGPKVADDPTLRAALSRPDSSVLAVGPHCAGEPTCDGPVVVAFDGSERSASVLPMARSWAHVLDVPIVLAHMWTPLDALDHGSEIFGAVGDALEVLGPSAHFEPVRTSYPPGGIRELAHELDASLVAMATIGSDATPGSVLGHVAAWVIREAPCPVLLVRPSAFPPTAGAPSTSASGGSDDRGPARLIELTPDECRALLASHGVGRVVFNDARHPVALPVNYAMDRDDIVFRTAITSSVLASSYVSRVSFQIDEFDARHRVGWSVLATGRVREISDPVELDDVERLGIAPWAGGPRDRYLRLTVRNVTGRRLAPERRSR
jgi:nucleotide-binding universal stress UspA family protein